ncbi:hypothetical protein Pla123a_30120 [Posidoniimonas polymericola]|uniref:Uncharacterized protein n=1 Tax=Posidoniimonas polymericola TaxID=2528002 RepID=A0A5C5YKR4_9BACT|nr:hypothetical protein [Posidoniimonas polymericola]TWT75503.1 hypothetical protein Pla123a_30120 [Posidoniimonas polymericola]
MLDAQKVTKLRRMGENCLKRYGEALDYFHAGSSSFELSSRLEHMDELWPEAQAAGGAIEYLQGAYGFAGQVYSMCLVGRSEVTDLDTIEAQIVNTLPPIRFLGQPFATAFEAISHLSPVLCFCARGMFSAAVSSEERFHEATEAIYSLLTEDPEGLDAERCDILQEDYRVASQELGVRLTQEWQILVATASVADPPPEASREPTRKVGGRPAGTKKTINERMRDLLESTPEAAAWSARQFATALDCSVSTIHGCETWKNLQRVREMQKQDRMSS